MGPFEQAWKLIFVDALECHGVDLDLEYGRAGRLDAGKHLVQRSPARYRAKFFGVQRVERDVDPADAGGAQIVRIFFELRAVGRHREFVELAGARMPRQRIDERYDAASHQGLTAGEAKFTHAAGNKGRAQAVELFQSEDFRLGEKRHVLRHAIDTAEVAAVRHRDAEIRNGAPE